MKEEAHPVAERVQATPETSSRPPPTPMTFVVDSTPRYENDILFFNTMDECLMRFDVVRVIATDGASVAHLARHWCKRNSVRFSLILLDRTISNQEDRKRRAELIIEQKPHAALFFNQFDRWLEFAKAFHAAAIPVSFVHPADQWNRPKWIEWQYGMTTLPQTPTMIWVAGPARRARKAERATEDHKKAVRAACNARHALRKRILKAQAKMEAGTFKGFRRRRKVTAIKPPGHAPTLGP